MVTYSSVCNNLKLSHQSLHYIYLVDLSSLVISVFSLQVIKVSRRVLSELGAQLGLYTSGSSERRQLVYDYHNVIKKVKEGQANGTGEGHCWAKVKSQDNGSMKFLTVWLLE